MKLQLSNLRKIGLSQQLAEVYLILLKIGPTTILALTREIGIPRTTCYHRLELLKKRGFIFEYIKNKRRIFSVRNPEIILKKTQNQLSEAKKINDTAKNLVEQLKSFIKTPPSYTHVKFYEGKENVWEVFEQTLRTNKDSFWYGFGKSFLGQYDFQKFLTIFSKRRRQFGQTKTYNILPPDSKIKKISERGETDFQEFRFLKKDIDFSAGVCIFGNKVAIFSFEKEISAAIIDGVATARLLESMFFTIWQGLPKFPIKNCGLLKK